MQKQERESGWVARFGAACELRRKAAVLIRVGAVCLLAAPAWAMQEHGAAQHAEAAASHAEASWSALFWPVLNFIILVGVLYYFLKTPVVGYVRDRHAGIRKDLREAAELKQSAEAQMVEIDRKLQALPGELAALKQRGVDDIAAEEQRIAREAAAERDRLLEQARQEIAFQVRIAKREILEHAADVAMAMATDRIKQSITAADQDRLVDAYLEQVKPTERH